MSCTVYSCSRINSHHDERSRSAAFVQLLNEWQLMPALAGTLLRQFLAPTGCCFSACHRCYLVLHYLLPSNTLVYEQYTVRSEAFQLLCVPCTRCAAAFHDCCAALLVCCLAQSYPGCVVRVSNSVLRGFVGFSIHV